MARGGHKQLALLDRETGGHSGITVECLRSGSKLRSVGNGGSHIGADEGFELAKATLCLKGYTLYNEVWNDQPPLHTFLITQILKHISPSVLGPRLRTSVFAVVLLPIHLYR